MLKNNTSRGYPIEIWVNGDRFIMESSHALKRYGERYKILFKRWPENYRQKFFSLLEKALVGEMECEFRLPYGWLMIGQVRDQYNQGFWQIIIDVNNKRRKVIKTTWHTALTERFKPRVSSRFTNKERRKKGQKNTTNRKRRQRKKVRELCDQIAKNWRN